MMDSPGRPPTSRLTLLAGETISIRALKLDGLFSKRAERSFYLLYTFFWFRMSKGPGWPLAPRDVSTRTHSSQQAGARSTAHA